MRRPSYTLNNSTLFFGLNEVDFIGLGGWFLAGLTISEQLGEFQFLPVVNLLISALCLILFRLKFRRHTTRDILLRLLTRSVIRVS